MTTRWADLTPEERTWPCLFCNEGHDWKHFAVSALFLAVCALCGIGLARMRDS